MKFISLTLSIVAATIAVAQTPAGTGTERVVAVVNGETITAEMLDALYANIPVQMRAQYEKAGGKKAYLDNYIAKRLLVQQAVKNGFDKKPDVHAALEAARESALFDRYIREVVAAEVIPEAAARKFYDENIDDFIVGEEAKVRHLFITMKNRRQDEALELVQKIFMELQAHRITFPPGSEEGRRLFRARFAEVARKHSEDSTAKEGGDLGWIGRGKFDPKFEEVAFGMPVGIMSGIVATPLGYHLILIDDKKPAGAKPFDEVRRDIREYLLSQKQADVVAAVTRLTAQLRAGGKVAVYPENLD